jgi:hypothetical protein
LLETAHWAARLPPRSLIHFNAWEHREDSSRDARGHSLADLVQSPAIWRELFGDLSADGSADSILQQAIADAVADPDGKS